MPGSDGRVRPISVPRVPWQECCCVEGVTNGDYSHVCCGPWECPQHKATTDWAPCPECDGAGGWGVTGYSLDPFRGAYTPDPQEERWEECPTCRGDGAVRKAEAA